MALIKSNNLIKEVHKSPAKVQKLSVDQYEFIIRRFLHYVTQALIHGFSISLKWQLWIRPAYILYDDIPKRHRKYLQYSNRIFGYVFVPHFDEVFLNKYKYNYKPDPAILSAMKDMSETDDIYTLMKR